MEMKFHKWILSRCPVTHARSSNQPSVHNASLPPAAANRSELEAPPETAEIISHASITENTTRLLDRIPKTVSSFLSANLVVAVALGS